MARFCVKQCADAEDLPLPQYMTEGAAGMDLFANVHDEVVIPVGEKRIIPTGIKISIPRDFEAQIRPRSGLAQDFGVTIFNRIGTIDSDYRGEIRILMINHGEKPYVVKRGDRIAQMIVAPIVRVEWTVLKSDEELDETARGEKGFGHTGYN